MFLYLKENEAKNDNEDEEFGEEVLEEITQENHEVCRSFLSRFTVNKMELD